jgi:16S rRNA (cytosine967-C5)-methyltransferase
MPDWLAATLEREAGDGAAALAASLNEPGPVCLRPNLLATTPEALAGSLRREGVETRPGRWVEGSLVVLTPRPNLYGLASWRGGLFEVQDEGSQLLGATVAARPGDEVLDLCAGAGGKALQLASAVGARGRVHAADGDPDRLARLQERARRAGAANLTVHGAEPPAGLRVDRALVDAPCSGLGALRRGPDLRFRIDPASFEPLPALQLALLGRAAPHVRPGGRLVYATCTFRREEDEEVVRAFEDLHPGFARVRPSAHPDLLDGEGFLHAWPHLHGTDGFFAAAWERRG